MSVTTEPRLLWQGPTSWYDVGHVSSLGQGRTYVGPVPSVAITPQLASAITGRVAAVVEQACEVTGSALIHNPDICSRCARTLMRSALGSPEDAALVMTGAKPGDAERYAKAWKVMGRHVQAAQAALDVLRAEASLGAVHRAPARAMTSGSADASLSVKNSPWAYLYEQGGWPLKAGQWTDYKMCACGDPTQANPKTTMMVSGVAPTSDCGCKHAGSPA